MIMKKWFLSFCQLIGNNHRTLVGRPGGPNCITTKRYRCTSVAFSHSKTALVGTVSYRARKALAAADGFLWRIGEWYVETTPHDTFRLSVCVPMALPKGTKGNRCSEKQLKTDQTHTRTHTHAGALGVFRYRLLQRCETYG